MRSISAKEFVRRLKAATTSSGTDSRYTFFLGAGCSISSGIPGAASLVKDYWLPRLKGLETGDDREIKEWVTTVFPGYTDDNAALFYGPTIERLFLNPQERQKEIERLVGGKDPGFGYAVLAQLLSNQESGRHCNVVLTTNFDDMVPDALYLYSNQKPLVIVHESLIGFMKITGTRPVVLKLHGDARLAPKNTEIETGELDKAVQRVLKNLLEETGLIFVGYGGNDKSMVQILKQIGPGGLPWGLYWINDHEPEGEMKEWLEERNAIWVNHLDFDEIMLLVLNEFGFQHPTNERFEKLLTNYRDNFKNLSQKILAGPKTPESKILEDAVQKATSQFKDWSSAYLQAEMVAKSDSSRADQIYQEGIKSFPNESQLLGNYALFLYVIRKDYDRAEEFYKKAIEANPTNSVNLENYANFLEDTRKDHDKAEEFYKKAIEADPNNAINLGNYANFLEDTRKDHDKAEEFYKKAIEADPNNAINLGNYANFLEYTRKDYDKAEEFYKKAIEADPNNAINLGNYTNFLEYTRKDHDKAEEFYKKAIQADPNNAINLGNYANFLEYTRKDYDKAEEFYKKAIEADPNNATNLGNYGGFLFVLSRKDEATKFVREAIEKGKNLLPLALECHFYIYAHSDDGEERSQSLKQLKKLLTEGIRSPGWNLYANVSKAITDGHSSPEFLQVLAKATSDEAKIEELDKFEEWRTA